jgi:penicillin-binding protein 2
MTGDSPRLRLGIVGIVVFSLFAALVLRVSILQILAADQYTQVSESNRVRVIAEEAPRGRILDTNGKVLVGNRSSRVVTIERDELDALDAADRRGLLTRLATELTGFGVPTKVARLERRVVDPQYSPLQPIPVAIDVSPEFEVFLAERSAEFPGVSVRRETVRSYPYGASAAHLVGYVGRISADEYAVATEVSADAATAAANGDPPPVVVDGVIANAAITKPYQPDSGVGRTGLERAYEADLRGVPGRRTVEIDSSGTPVRTTEVIPAVPGADIQLTIDIDLQERTESELAAQLENLRGSRIRAGAVTKAPAGSVVLADPGDGSVRALASFPTFQPADFVNGISVERYETLTGGAATENPLINRAISGQYAPGSTFKPLTAWAALATGLVDAGVTFNDQGSYRLAGCEGPACLRTNNNGTALGVVDISRSLTQSSNVFYYWLGERFWQTRAARGDLFQDSLAQLGLGQTTGVDLGGEAAGVVPGPRWKKDLWEVLPPDQQEFGDPTWYPGDEVSMAIGQGDVLVTPLQMAFAFGVFANGGTLYAPRLVERVIPWDADPADPTSGVVVGPVVVREVAMESAWRNVIVSGMLGVTQQGSGTASSAFAGWDQDAWPVAAKTGTAEVAGRADSSVFGAFGPANNPDLVAFAVLEESGFGGEAAAPMVRRILDFYVGAVPVSGGGT